MGCKQFQTDLRFAARVKWFRDVQKHLHETSGRILSDRPRVMSFLGSDGYIRVAKRAESHVFLTRHPSVSYDPMEDARRRAIVAVNCGWKSLENLDDQRDMMKSCVAWTIGPLTRKLWSVGPPEQLSLPSFNPIVLV